MARRSREDTPGSWHHVINRGIARRLLFEDRVELRYFLSRLAREVRRGRIEIHAFCLMATHFHLLVRSPCGELSEALRSAQNQYSRFFNRRHRRDGTLIRGRFFSKPVTSLSYQRALVRYIDANPVGAHVVTRACRYPPSSAAMYAQRSGPPWLERSWVEAEVRAVAEAAEYHPDDYELAFPALEGGPLQRVLDRRVEHGRGPDALDNLVAAAPKVVRQWMQRKARLADGMAVGQPICDSVTIQSAVNAERSSSGTWKSSARTRACDLWLIALAGFLRDLAGLTWSEIADICECSSATSHARYRSHQKLVKEDGPYAVRTSELAADVIAQCFGKSQSTKPMNRVRLGI